MSSTSKLLKSIEIAFDYGPARLAGLTNLRGVTVTLYLCHVFVNPVSGCGLMSVQPANETRSQRAVARRAPTPRRPRRDASPRALVLVTNVHTLTLLP